MNKIAHSPNKVEKAKSLGVNALAAAAWAIIVAGIAACACLALLLTRHVAIGSLFGSERSHAARKFALEGSPASFELAEGMARLYANEIKEMKLPSLEGAIVLAEARIAPSGPNSYSFSLWRLCLIDHGLDEKALSFMSTWPSAQKAALAFATAHEMGHCSFYRLATDKEAQGKASLAMELDQWAFASNSAKSDAQHWAGRALNESYADMLALAYLARKLTPEEFKNFGHFLFSERVEQHMRMLDKAIRTGTGSDADFSKIGVHFTQFALDKAYTQKQDFLAKLSGSELERWAMDTALFGLALGAKNAPEFAHLRKSASKHNHQALDLPRSQLAWPDPSL